MITEKEAVMQISWFTELTICSTNLCVIYALFIHMQVLAVFPYKELLQYEWNTKMEN